MILSGNYRQVKRYETSLHTEVAGFEKGARVKVIITMFRTESKVEGTRYGIDVVYVFETERHVWVDKQHMFDSSHEQTVESMFEKYKECLHLTVNEDVPNSIFSIKL